MTDYTIQNGCFEASDGRGKSITIDWDGFVFVDGPDADVSIQLTDEQFAGLRKYIIEQFEEELE